MDVREVVCDAEQCECRKNTARYSVFSHTKYNGVDTDTWDHVFDLCPGHAAVLLAVLLKDLDPVYAKAVLDTYGINTRMG
jgi:hypothetical protein